MGMKLWQFGMQSPALYKMGGWAAKIATNLIKNQNGVITKVPPPFSGWTDSRDFKPFAGESFRERMKKRKQ
jgi:L-lactate dehydrogenase complex protein LldF